MGGAEGRARTASAAVGGSGVARARPRGKYTRAGPRRACVLAAKRDWRGVLPRQARAPDITRGSATRDSEVLRAVSQNRPYVIMTRSTLPRRNSPRGARAQFLATGQRGSDSGGCSEMSTESPILGPLPVSGRIRAIHRHAFPVRQDQCTGCLRTSMDVGGQFLVSAEGSIPDER